MHVLSIMLKSDCTTHHSLIFCSYHFCSIYALTLNYPLHLYISNSQIINAGIKIEIKVKKYQKMYVIDSGETY